MNLYAIIGADGIVRNVTVGMPQILEGYTVIETFEDLPPGGPTNPRKNYARIGGTYDLARNAFISVKPFSDWVLDEETCRWKAP